MKKKHRSSTNKKHKGLHGSTMPMPSGEIMLSLSFEKSWVTKFLWGFSFTSLRLSDFDMEP